MIPCPYTFNTPAQFDAMRYLTLILGLFSFLFEMFLIPAYGLFPLARRWPARLLLYYFIANFLGMTGILISWRGESVWYAAKRHAETDASPLHQSPSLCSTLAGARTTTTRTPRSPIACAAYRGRW